MALSLVAVVNSAGSTGVTTTFTTNVPSGVQDGDLLLWTLTSNNANVASTPSGWNVWRASTTTGLSLSTFWRIAASEPADYTHASLTSARWGGGMAAFRGADQTTPADVAFPTANAGTTSLTCPAITPVTAGAWVYAIGSVLGPSGTVDVTWTSSNLDVVPDQDFGSNVAAAANAFVGTGHEAWSSGAFTAVLTDDVVTTRTIGASTAIRPATAANGTINAVTATATAAALVPVVAGAATVSGVLATASALALAPTASAGASVVAPAATATALALPPTVSGNATVAGTIATATALALAPVVAGNATVTAVTATATAAALPPVVDAVQSPTVTAPAATATALALPPAAFAGGSADVTPPTATASALALPPVVAGTISVTVQAVAAQANAEALAAVVAGTANAVVVAVTATATALALPPEVTTGTIGVDGDVSAALVPRGISAALVPPDPVTAALVARGISAALVPPEPADAALTGRLVTAALEAP